MPTHWEPAHAAAYAANWVVVAGVAPVVEELTYRGLGFSLIAERFGKWLAIVAIGLLFAASHGLFQAFPELAMLGCGARLAAVEDAQRLPGDARARASFNSIALAVVFFATEGRSQRSVVFFVGSASAKSSAETRSRKRLNSSTMSSSLDVLAVELDRRLLDHLVGGEDRRLRAHRDRDRVGGARVDLDLRVAVLDRDRGVEGVLAQLGDRNPHDLDLELAEDVDEQVVRERPRRRRALELHQDRRRLGMADPDRQVPVSLGRLQEHDRLLADEIERDPVDRHLDHLSTRWRPYTEPFRLAFLAVRPAPSPIAYPRAPGLDRAARRSVAVACRCGGATPTGHLDDERYTARARAISSVG